MLIYVVALRNSVSVSLSLCVCLCMPLYLSVCVCISVYVCVLVDYYTVDMVGLKVDCEVLGELDRSAVVRLDKLLNRSQISSSV